MTYCQYGDHRQKPTDLWGVWPDSWVPKPPCKRGAPCHDAAPRGSKLGGVQRATGSFLRSILPYGLGMDICLATEHGLGAMPVGERLFLPDAVGPKAHAMPA